MSEPDDMVKFQLLMVTFREIWFLLLDDFQTTKRWLSTQAKPLGVPNSADVLKALGNIDNEIEPLTDNLLELTHDWPEPLELEALRGNYPLALHSAYVHPTEFLVTNIDCMIMQLRDAATTLAETTVAWDRNYGFIDELHAAIALSNLTIPDVSPIPSIQVDPRATLAPRLGAAYLLLTAEQPEFKAGITTQQGLEAFRDAATRSLN